VSRWLDVEVVHWAGLEGRTVCGLRIDPHQISEHTTRALALEPIRTTFNPGRLTCEGCELWVQDNPLPELVQARAVGGVFAALWLLGMTPEDSPAASIQEWADKEPT
jgi:hypothetical protein